MADVLNLIEWTAIRLVLVECLMRLGRSIGSEVRHAL